MHFQSFAGVVSYKTSVQPTGRDGRCGDNLSLFQRNVVAGTTAQSVYVYGTPNIGKGGTLWGCLIPSI